MEQFFGEMPRVVRLICVVLFAAGGARGVDVDVDVDGEPQILAGGLGGNPEEVKAQLLEQLKAKGYDTDGVEIGDLGAEGAQPKVGLAELYATQLRDRRVLGATVGVWLATLGAGAFCAAVAYVVNRGVAREKGDKRRFSAKSLASALAYAAASWCLATPIVYGAAGCSHEKGAILANVGVGWECAAGAVPWR